MFVLPCERESTKRLFFPFRVCLFVYFFLVGYIVHLSFVAAADIDRQTL
jgi:hypothetical protein